MPFYGPDPMNVSGRSRINTRADGGKLVPTRVAYPVALPEAVAGAVLLSLAPSHDHPAYRKGYNSGPHLTYKDGRLVVDLMTSYDLKVLEPRTGTLALVSVQGWTPTLTDNAPAGSAPHTYRLSDPPALQVLAVAEVSYADLAPFTVRRVADPSKEYSP